MIYFHHLSFTQFLVSIIRYQGRIQYFLRDLNKVFVAKPLYWGHLYLHLYLYWGHIWGKGFGVCFGRNFIRQCIEDIFRHLQATSKRIISVIEDAPFQKNSLCWKMKAISLSLFEKKNTIQFSKKREEIYILASI